MRPPDQAPVVALEESSLARIQRHERATAARIAEAHQVAAGRVAEAAAEAVTRVERAREAGLREADRRLESVLEVLDQELAGERNAALERASRFRALVARDASDIAQELLPVVLPTHHRRGA